MKKKTYLGLLALVAVVAVAWTIQARSEKTPRSLYVFEFGGLEHLEAEGSAELVSGLGYSGIAVHARGDAGRERLDTYHEWSRRSEGDFKVEAAFMSHRFDRVGLSDTELKAAIDRMEGNGGRVWVWLRDAKPDGRFTAKVLEDFIVGIADYAQTKGVEVVIYPHYDTFFDTTDDALDFLEKVDHPSLSTAINLCHELIADKGDVLEQTFERAKGRISAIMISGALTEVDRSSAKGKSGSTILSLDESVYDLRPYMRLIKESGFEGPIAFINFNLQNPADHLERSMIRWKELCEEIGLYELDG
ncbi:sugar phosphate isomerase/epimerase family protein [Pelagicoccus mobilis]|uniref:TIM barrel protein n=1 Tax=Pelagicoccus mobilis TaxID=415221 RepID=A0A934RYN1_9BACT|nr:TIM barrel protein [Pelagicoccus mobilis]MBK1879011.1 TIM barrel protein [Pelagicoccus mobilis]